MINSINGEKKLELKTKTPKMSIPLHFNGLYSQHNPTIGIKNLILILIGQCKEPNVTKITLTENKLDNFQQQNLKFIVITAYVKKKFSWIIKREKHIHKQTLSHILTLK